ncbi:MAG: hypothetical protein H6658_04685 [Ardenticatenaceae bacterium]|nr:hypothetical protein [Ardenticatenaceae bacterium]
MTWQEACNQYPDQYLLIEVLAVNVPENSFWIVENFSIVEAFPNLGKAMEHFQELESSYSQGKLLVVSTKQEKLQFFPLWSDERE